MIHKLTINCKEKNNVQFLSQYNDKHLLCRGVKKEKFFYLKIETTKITLGYRPKLLSAATTKVLIIASITE